MSSTLAREAPPATVVAPPTNRAAVAVVAAVALLLALAVVATSFGPTATTKAALARVPAASAAVDVPTIRLAGLADGAVLGADAVADGTVALVVTDAPPSSVAVTLDDAPLALSPGDVAAAPGATLLGPQELGALDEGAHELVVTAGVERRGSGTATRAVTFEVDTTPPEVVLPDAVAADSLRDSLVVELTVLGAADVEVAGAAVEQAGDQVTATFPSTPREVVATAVDAAGNTTTASLPVSIGYPGGRAVHTTPSAWRYAPKREPIIAMIRAGQIDAVQMDIKDELGDVGWDTDVELAGRNGAEDFNRTFDMAAAVDQIHDLGARVIGRLTVYRDTRLAQWAWNNGRRDMVVQATDGTPYQGRYGDYAFTNFANPDVQQYNIDIALEAAELGFDEVLYDYIRRPDGPMEKLVVPGLGDTSPEDAVVEVMATAYPLLRERGVWVGASVFGIAVDRPTQMAQHIPSMAPHVDYIAPMVYPNHWNLGEYGVAVPEDAPYEIVERSLTLFHDQLAGTDTALVPWLQDFGGYGEREVRAQIDATEAVTGERSFLLWASSATYTEAALDPVTPDEPPAG